MGQATSAVAAARQAGRDDETTAREVVAALTKDTPASNFAVGTLLQSFELVIVTGSDTVGAPGAVVARALPGTADAFEVVGHYVDLSFGHASGRRWTKRVAVSGIAAPSGASDGGESA
ncbi:hypothetical protein PAI11_37330 [Patulibacter medicamentivorans]|uniref:Uncharacterized protein n=2 Tax=Patulibacter medicamentivorans TaxID=1097667 RepID=H0EA59_9ACTN|nr:hypothetical protein PAI11_37330 [Patulibacter medicamentivorans]